MLGVLGRLQAAGVPAWLDGGWCVDALLGEQTRRHDDLDLVAPLDGVERLGAALAPLLAVGVPRAEGVALTERERQLLQSLEEGLRFKQIAPRLGISEATAKTHARNLFRKLDATSRAEAVHAARERGVLA